MRFPLPSRTWAVPVIGVLLALIGPWGAPPLAQAGSAPPFVPGRVVLMLSPEAGRGLDPTAKAGLAVPSYLGDAGVLDLRRTAPRRPDGRRRPPAAPADLDRVYTARIADGVDPREACARLEADPRVLYAHPDYLGQGGGVELPEADDTEFEDQWHLSNLGQSGGSLDADMDVVEAWRWTVGRPETRIAVLDTGIDGDHRDFRGRIAPGGIDFVQDDADPEADHNHGSRVAGLFGALTNNRFAVSGVDWAATILPIKILNQSNLGSTSDLAAGLRFAADSGVAVANLSLIRYPNTTTLRLAVEYAHAAGVIQIGCNGNDGVNEWNYPASYPEVLSVGWTDDDDRRASLSNFTSTLDVVAPGHAVRTVVHNSTFDGSSVFSGCSAATPNVVGVVGLLLALDPSLTQEQVGEILRSTADDEVGSLAEDTPGRDDYHGWGRVNAEAALQSLGLVSAQRIHIHDVTLARSGASSIAARVTVLDDLNGVEAGVEVQGLLTPPDTAATPLSGTTGPGGIAKLTWIATDGFPAGSFAFEVTSLSLAGHTWDTAADRESSAVHDPALNALHVAGLWSRDSYDSLTIDVQVADDDGTPEHGVSVAGTLTPAVGAPVPAFATTRGAAGGVAQFVFTVPGGGDFAPGFHNFEVTSLTKSGFVHHSEQDVDGGILVHNVVDRFGDADRDGVVHGVDNCGDVANPEQADTDHDGIGNACDVCPGRFDPAQRDTDGDGVGDRCDCAPWDGDRAAAEAVQTLRLDGERLDWTAVATADRYDITRGNLATLGLDPIGPCLADDVVDTGWVDTDTPPAGTGFAYLVRADDDACGPGPFAGAGGGAPRIDTGPGACD